MEYVGVARRFVAVLVDGLVFLLLGLIFGLLTGGGYSTTSGGVHEIGVQAGTKATLLALLFFFAYYVFCETLFGRTLGKRVMSLRVVSENGVPIDLGAAVIRNLLRIIDGLFFYLVAAVSVWSSPKRQRLGDRAAGTYVVHDSPAAARIWHGADPPGRTPSATGGASPFTYSEEDFKSDLARARRFADS
jgi:uncharacterized RDD family membrane protein YckC